MTTTNKLWTFFTLTLIMVGASSCTTTRPITESTEQSVGAKSTVPSSEARATQLLQKQVQSGSSASGTILSIAELVEKATVIAEVQSTQVTNLAHNTIDGLPPTDPNDSAGTYQIREVAVSVTSYLKGSDAYPQAVGFVLSDPGVDSIFSPVGTEGVILLSPIASDYLLSPEPFRQRTLDLAAQLGNHEVMFREAFYRYNGDQAIDPQTGDLIPKADLLQAIQDALGS